MTRIEKITSLFKKIENIKEEMRRLTLNNRFYFCVHDASSTMSCWGQEDDSFGSADFKFTDKGLEVESRGKYTIEEVRAMKSVLTASMSTMTIRDFITSNYADLHRLVGKDLPADAREQEKTEYMEKWVKLDEGVAMWARSQGVEL